MADLFDNPMGLMGFEFVEFASPTPGVLEPLFEKLGFTLVAKHRSKNVLLYRQGGINFIINNEPGQAAYFAAEHGASACGLAFRVKDAHQAYKRALELGAQPVEIPTGPMELRLPAIKGIRSEEHTSELQSQSNLVCRLLLEKKNPTDKQAMTGCDLSALKTTVQ